MASAPLNAFKAFKGLDLPQLLALMEPIIPPEPVSWLPQTVGWQIIGGWLIALALLQGVARLRRYRRNRYRVAALAALAQLSAEADDLGEQVGTLLKRTAMAAYTRERVGRLTGDAWAKWLLTSTSAGITPAQASLLASAPYRQQSDPEALLRAARQWIQTHHA